MDWLLDMKKKRKTYPVNIVKKDHQHIITREKDPDERWDADDIAHEITICGWTHANGEWGDFYFKERPSETKQFFLVYVIHSTGDSFHSEEGVVQEVALLESYEDAQFLANYIQKDEKRISRHKITLPSKEKFEYYNGDWTGYFEHLTGVEIELVHFVIPKSYDPDDNYR